jgi:mannose-1-phosphate guanylyltransferase
MLLAAGFGRRMVPITLFRAKPSLPFLNRPLLLRTLDWLAACGVGEVVVNLHHRPESLLALIDGSRPAVSLSPEAEILGTAGGLRRAAAHFRGAGTFLCVNADFVCEIDLGEVVRAHHASGLPATMVLTPWEPNCGYTQVRHNGHRVYAFGDGDAPAHADRLGIFTGIQVLEPSVLDMLPDGPSELVPALYRPLIAAGRGPGVFLTRGRWAEVGTPRHYIDEQVRALAGTPYARHRDWPSGLSIAPGCDIAATTQTDPFVAVGEGCRLGAEVVLGRGVILGRGVEVGAGAHLSHCVVLDGARIGARARVRESVIGPGTTVAAGLTLSGAVVDGGDGSPPPPQEEARPARLENGLWRADI